jgi:hypothetical protein
MSAVECGGYRDVQANRKVGSDMKAVTKRYITGTLMVLAGIMPLAPARAADTPVVKVNMQEHIQAGHVADGQRLGRGL